jgi:hypothetical protein
MNRAVNRQIQWENLVIHGKLQMPVRRLGFQRSRV